MPKKKAGRKAFNNAFGKAPYDIIIAETGKAGKEDCVHHEIVTRINTTDLRGKCKKCGQVKIYEDKLHKKVVDHAASVQERTILDR